MGELHCMYDNKPCPKKPCETQCQRGFPKKLWKDKTDEEILVDTKSVLDSYREVTKKSLLPGDVFIDGKWYKFEDIEVTIQGETVEPMKPGKPCAVCGDTSWFDTNDTEDKCPIHSEPVCIQLRITESTPFLEALHNYAAEGEIDT